MCSFKAKKFEEEKLFCKKNNLAPCPRITFSRVKMTFFKRCLVVFFLQFGCLALDHSTRELTYEEDHIRLIVGNQFNANSKLENHIAEEESQQSPSSGLSFHPNFLDFKDSPVGIPRLGIVRVDNRLKNEVKLISISGSTVQFHSSFFADKVVGPGGNTTFEIVFLSRSEGQTEADLYIHTSMGMFKYNVKGFGLPNPYRMRPLIGARIPMNGSYEPLITMHNPHKRRIQVVEMLSSWPDFQLKLPDGVEEESEGAAWAIEPFQTKPVMKGSFQGKTEGNHTGYIKIKVNNTKTSSEYLLVPVEVQVSSAPGIYSPQDSLDFGIMVRTDKPKTLSLSLINAQETPINIKAVSVKGDVNPAVKIEFRPIMIEPDSAASTVVALVTFNPSAAHNLKFTAGLIEIRSESGKFISVPFRANIYQGELQFNSSSLGFFINSETLLPPRNFSVQNNFQVTIAIYEVSVSHPDLVKIENFNDSHVLSPGRKKTIFSLRIQKRNELCDLSPPAEVTVKSNITKLKLPITCYDGKLSLHSLEENHIAFGRMELFSSQIEYFSVENKNPIEIRLKSWGANCSWSHVDLVGMQKGAKEDLVKIKDFDNMKKSLFLQPGHMAVFSIEIRRPSTEGLFYGESYVTTDHNQTLRVPFNFAVSKGSVNSDVLTFEKSFPGKISSEKLFLSSTFNQTLSLRNVKTNPPALMWFTPSSMQENPEILPHRKNYVGKVHFDPRKFCGKECYSGFLTDSTIGKEWTKAANLNWETREIDWNVLCELQKRFEFVKEITVSNVTLWLETSEMSGYKVSTQINYSWPRLASSKVALFPLTGLGNQSVYDIYVTNPSNSPIIVQAVLASQYGPHWSQFVQGNGVGGNVSEGNHVFSLESVSSSSQANSSGMTFTQVQKQMVEEILNVKDASGISIFLPPGAKFVFRAKFEPRSKETASTLLLLRNNLTGIETIWLKGRAGTGQLTLGNGASGSSLLFQITEKLLQGCQQEGTSKYAPPQLTVRRSFVARNVGEIPLDIVILEVYPPQSSYWPSLSASKDMGCEGYGFRILNCHPFTLLPNHTHSIDIAFTPDFTVSRVVRSLRLTDSSGGSFNYSLVAMVPSGILSVCASIITRPSWEPLLKYLMFAAILLGIFAAGLMAYFEAGTVVSSAIVTTVRVVPADQRPDGKEVTNRLDLKSVYDKVDNRFKRNQQNSSKAVANSNSVPTGREKENSLRQRRKKGNNYVPATSNIDPPIVGNMSDPVGTNGGKQLTNLEIANLKIGAASEELINSLSLGKNNGMDGGKKGKKMKGMKNQAKAHQLTLKKQEQKEEEESCSTTTESSNPDELASSYPIPSMEKAPSEKSSSGNEKENLHPNPVKVQKSNKKMEREKNSNAGKENGATTPPSEIDELKEEFDLVIPASAKKRNLAKKKEKLSSEFFTVNGNINRAVISPKQDISWDNSQVRENDMGHSEGFVSKSTVSPGPNTKRSPVENHGKANPTILTGPCGLMTFTQANGNFNNHMAPQRPRRPGVIGQKRFPQQESSVIPSLTTLAISLSTITPPVSSSTSSHGSSNSRPSTSGGNRNGWEILSDNGTGIWNRAQSECSSGGYSCSKSPTYRSASRPSGEYQNIVGTTGSSTPSVNHRESGVFNPPSSHPYTSQSNFNRSSENMPSRSSPKIPNNGYSFSQMEAFAGMQTDVLASLWQMNNPYDQSHPYRQRERMNSPASSTQSQVYHPPTLVSLQGSHGNQQNNLIGYPQPNPNVQHNFVQRIRSEPSSSTSSRRDSRGFPTTDNWNNASYYGMEQMRQSGTTTTNSHWPTIQSGTGSEQETNSSYGDWMRSERNNGGQSGSGRGSSEDLWDSASNKWLTSPYRNTSPFEQLEKQYPTTTASFGCQSSFGGATSPNSLTFVGSGTSSVKTIFGPSESQMYTPTGHPPMPFIDPAAVGSRRMNGNIVNHADPLFRSRAELAQNHREVEAGLGFNPFTADIWNGARLESEWAGSPERQNSSSSSYRYPPTNE